jgi:ubiquinone/menaquinone biosynthesis C-methylase UbiE
METWYDDLLSDPVAAATSLEHDYEPYAGILSSLSGVILDVGGGIGLPRHFLRDDSRYVVLDPSLTWLQPKWMSLASKFPCVRTAPPFIQGIGEFMPFADSSVDAVLACWSLNHVTDPKQVLWEISRILRFEGRCIIILEDMIPSHKDVIQRVLGALRQGHWSSAREHARHLFPSVRKKWPLQSDHIRVTETQLSAWMALPLKLVRRSWVGDYLTLEASKTS